MILKMDSLHSEITLVVGSEDHLGCRESALPNVSSLWPLVVLPGNDYHVHTCAC